MLIYEVDNCIIIEENISSLKKYILRYLGVKGDGIYNLLSNVSDNKKVYIYICVYVYIHTHGICLQNQTG